MKAHHRAIKDYVYDICKKNREIHSEQSLLAWQVKATIFIQ